MKIEDLQVLCKDNTIQVTEHAFRQCRERNISLNDIKKCIMFGEIIEDYPNDYPFPSALILEYSFDKPIHVVAGIGNGYLWIITAYYPDNNKWENDFKTRKVN